MNKTVSSIEDVPINGFHQLLTLRSGGGWLMDGYILSIIGVAMVPLSSALHLSSGWEGLIAASALLGMFCGGFLGGGLTDKLGRQKLYFLPPILFTICSLLQFWVSSGSQIFWLRFLIGIGVGIEYPVAGSLLVEFMPRKSRGPRLASLTILWFLGAALAYIVATIILARAGENAWRWMLMSPAVIGFFLFLIRLGSPESPRWLMQKGRLQEADSVIKKVYGPSFSLDNLPEQPVSSSVSLKSLLHSGYGKRMLFVGVFWTSSVIPVFAVYAFAPQVLKSLNLTGGWQMYGSICITLMFVLGCIIATWLVNVLGRRSLLIHSFFWSAMALVGLAVFAGQSKGIVLALLAAYAIFIGGAQVLQLVYPNELFPTEIRTFAVGMGASISRIGAAVGTWLAPLALRDIGGANTMLAAAAISGVGLIVSYLLAPETKSLNLAEAASLDR